MPFGARAKAKQRATQTAEHERVLKCLSNGPKVTEDIKASLGWSTSKVRAVLERMRATGQVCQTSLKGVQIDGLSGRGAAYCYSADPPKTKTPESVHFEEAVPDRTGPRSPHAHRGEVLDVLIAEEGWPLSVEEVAVRLWCSEQAARIALEGLVEDRFVLRAGDEYEVET